MARAAPAAPTTVLGVTKQRFKVKSEALLLSLFPPAPGEMRQCERQREAPTLAKQQRASLSGFGVGVCVTKASPLQVGALDPSFSKILSSDSLPVGHLCPPCVSAGQGTSSPNDAMTGLAGVSVERLITISFCGCLG